LVLFFKKELLPFTTVVRAEHIATERSMDIDAKHVAERLTRDERRALLSLPATDRGGLPDEMWWGYYAILDAGLAASAGNFRMVATPLGHAVLHHLGAIGATA
jgi:hypothetical protein